MKVFYKVCLLVLSWVLSINYGFAQIPNWVWAKRVGGTSLDVGFSIINDKSGNIYTTGWFSGTADFDPDTGLFILTSHGSLDIFISKLDPSGNFVWAKSIGGPSDDTGLSIVLDSLDNIYVTGYFSGTADFDPGGGTLNLISTGINNVFISKFDSAGNLIWAKSFGGSGNDGGNSITLDALGNVYTAGVFSGVADFNPGSGIYNLTSIGSEDIFISKLDSSGNFVWAKAIGGIDWDEGYSITTDDYGNIYATGSYLNTVDFNPNTGIYNLTSAGGYDIFIVKLDSSGNFIWAKTISGPGNNDESNVIKLDALANILISGYFYGMVDFDPGPGTFNLNSSGGYDIFIAKLDSSGNFIWAKGMGGSGNDNGISMTLDDLGNVYSTGYFNGSADFDPSVNTFNLTSISGNDIYVSKLDSSGNFVWAKSTGGIGIDIGKSINIDNNGNVQLCGTFSSPSISFGFTTLTNANSGGNSNDIFIAKLDAVTGIEEGMLQNNDVKISPNPTTSSCTITAPSFINSNVTLYDITGRALLQQPFNSTAELNLSAFSSDIYIIEVKDKQGHSAKAKVVKE